MNQIYEEEISLKELIAITYKRKNIIFISFIMVTLISIIYAYFPLIEKNIEYDAVSSISIVYNYKAPDNPEDIGEGYVFYQDRLQGIMIPTIKGYAQSLSILRSIITELNLIDDDGAYIKARKLAEDIEIVSQNDSNLILITAKYKNEQKAADIANKIPEKLIQMAKANPELSNYKINIVDYAVASETEGISNLLVVALGMILGVILGIFLIFVTNYFNKKVYSASQIRNIGLEIDLILKNIEELRNQTKIISLAELSNAEKLLLGVPDNLDNKFLENLNNVGKDNNINIEVVQYEDSDLLVRAKKVDRTFIIIQENISELKALEEMANLIRKYNINLSVIYVEK